MKLKINYGVYWFVPFGKKKRSKSLNGTIEVEGDWNSQDTHILIRHEISKKHPNTRILGYTLNGTESE